MSIRIDPQERAELDRELVRTFLDATRELSTREAALKLGPSYAHTNVQRFREGRWARMYPRTRRAMVAYLKRRGLIPDTVDDEGVPSAYYARVEAEAGGSGGALSDVERARTVRMLRALQEQGELMFGAWRDQIEGVIRSLVAGETSIAPDADAERIAPGEVTASLPQPAGQAPAAAERPRRAGGDGART